MSSNLERFREIKEKHFNYDNETIIGVIIDEYKFFKYGMTKLMLDLHISGCEMKKICKTKEIGYAQCMKNYDYQMAEMMKKAYINRLKDV